MWWRTHLMALGSGTASAAAAYPVLALAFGQAYWPELAWGARLAAFAAWSNPVLDLLPLIAAGVLGALAGRGRGKGQAAIVGAGLGLLAGALFILSWLAAGGHGPGFTYVPLVVPFSAAGGGASVVVAARESRR